MNYAVISSDRNQLYAFYAPLTAAVWRNRGWQVFMLLVGEEDDWLDDPRSKLVYEKCLEANARVHFISAYPGHRTSTVAQVSRLYAHLLPKVAPDDYLMTSDVDMWPLGPWVGGTRDSSKAFQLYFSNAYADADKVHFPMCYVGAQACFWKEAMDSSVSMDMKDALGKALNLCKKQYTSSEAYHRNGEYVPLDVWNFDETYFGEQLSALGGWKDRCQFIERDMSLAGERRIDRSNWIDAASVDGYADAHLFRPGFTPDNWSRASWLFQLAVTDQDQVAWAESYHDSYGSGVLLDDLPKRAEFWSDREKTNFEGASIGRPFDKHESVFRRARVLEIGPGDGRQFEMLQPLSKSYALADISKRILDKPIYEGVASKYLISSYSQNLNECFDVITFWYVMHHVLRTEAQDFFGFIRRHLKLGGYVYFNTAGGDHPDADAADGIGTTAHDLSGITRLLAETGFVDVDVEYLSYESTNILARRGS